MHPANQRKVRVAAAAAVASLGLFAASSALKADVTGFGGSAQTGWTPNADSASMTAGVPNVSGTGTAGDTLQITSTDAGEASSYWFNTPQTVLNWVANFTYTDVSTNGADGTAFVLQNQGPTALGGGGGQMGFGGITSAAGVAFNIWGGNSGSGSSYNTSFSNGGPANTPTTSAINLDSGHPINVTLSYRQADNAMVETLTDTITHGTQTKVYRSIDVSGAVGGGTALVGFTGGTGGANANQQITNFTFRTGSAAATPVAAFQPIAATGYNQNMVISNATGSALVTATMDGGTGLSGDTFYERGVNAGSPTGLPPAGQIVGSANDANHSFVFQPYSGNNAVMLDANNPTGSLHLNTAKAYQALSFLVAGSNGGGTFDVTIHFANGHPNEVHTGVMAPDWFGGSPIAVDPSGRVDTALDDFNAVGSGNPRIYQEDVTLADASDPISSIDVSSILDPSGNRIAIFGLSGIAVPEPASLGILSLGAVALLRRRRSA